MPPITFLEPGCAPLSIRATWRPARAIVIAAAVPAGPAPTTMASSFSSCSSCSAGRATAATCYSVTESGMGGRRCGCSASRAVQAPGSEGLRRLVAAFGPEILTSEGALDRARLGAVVFADAEARRRLNAIVHPLVREWMAERLREAAERSDEVVV